MLKKRRLEPIKIAPLFDNSPRTYAVNAGQLAQLPSQAVQMPMQTLQVQQQQQPPRLVQPMNYQQPNIRVINAPLNVRPQNQIFVANQ